MKDLVNKILSTSYNEIDDININLNEKTGINVQLDGYKYEFIIHLTDYDSQTIVFCPQELNYTQKKTYYNKAYFENQSLANEIKYNTIYFNDPTRYTFKYSNGLSAVGTPEVWHLKNIAKIIKKFVAMISKKGKKGYVNYDSLYFYGQSTGGFIAIELSVLIQNSTSIIEKPVFNLKNTSFWQGIRNSCFKKIPEQNVTKYTNRYNINSLIKAKDYLPNAHIFLDTDDKDAWKTQYKEFLDNLGNYDFLHNAHENRINIQFGGIISGTTKVSQQSLFNKIDDIIYIQEKNKSFNPTMLHMLIEFEDQMDIYYAKYQNKEITFNEFITLKNNYIKLWELSRVDFKNIGEENNKIEITNKDKSISIITPEWFKNKEGQGTIVFTKEKKFNLQIKTIKDGKLKIDVRGNDFLDENKLRKKIYTCINKLKIDDKTIINKNILIWHNDPYTTEISCKNNQIINLDIEFKTLLGQYPHIKEITQLMDTEETLPETYQNFKNHIKYLKMINTKI